MIHKTTSRPRFAAVPALILCLGLPALMNCGDEDLPGTGGLTCSEFSASSNFGADLDIDYRVKALMQGAGNFEVLADSMIKDTSGACINIAKAAGGDETKWAGKEGKDLVQAACDEAQAKVKAIFDANASTKALILIEGGKCEASLAASGECNAQCDVSGKCTPAQLEAKCEPGKLAGSCSATCEGTCRAEGGVAVTCKGGCSAVCQGTCDGTCDVKDAMGNCAGRCEGNCDGKCSGSCSITSDAMASCEGTCQGNCSAEFTAPKCEGKLTPPECQVDADCSASCNASVQAKAECSPPTVKYQLDASASAEFKALIDVLQVELPKLLLQVKVRGQTVVETGSALASSGQAVVKAAGDLGVKGLACAEAALEASAKASANVSVSVQVSASVSGSAGAGT